MIKTFGWKVERNLGIENKYRVIETQFGDGYVQSSADGINNRDESYSFRVNGNTARMKEIMAFFDEHKGFRSFFWTSPVTGLGLYRCADPTPEFQGGDLWVITGKFVRSFSAPAA